MEPWYCQRYYAVAGHPEPAPPMLRHPADAPPPAEHIGASEQVMLFRVSGQTGRSGSGRSLRGWAARISGRSDRRLLLALASATEAMAAYCDLLVDRITSQEALTADIAGAFGREIAQGGGGGALAAQPGRAEKHGFVNQLAAVVVGRRWLEPRSELAFATRSLAGAASRCGPVAVLVPGDLRQLEPDGAFDLQGLGFVEGLQWPDALPNDRPVIVDELTSEIAALLARTGATLSVVPLLSHHRIPATRVATNRARGPRPSGPLARAGEPPRRAAPSPRLRIHGLPTGARGPCGSPG